METAAVPSIGYRGSCSSLALGGVAKMAPTVVREGSYRLFFFSREEVRKHVHVAHPDGEAKFWLEPTIQSAMYVGLSQQQVAEAERIVRAHLVEIIDAWNKHFGG